MGDHVEDQDSDFGRALHVARWGVDVPRGAVVVAYRVIFAFAVMEDVMFTGVAVLYILSPLVGPL